jgi:hypothetical protein
MFPLSYPHLNCLFESSYLFDNYLESIGFHFAFDYCLGQGDYWHGQGGI